ALYEILKDPDNGSGAAWNKNGNAFRFKDMNKLFAMLQALGSEAKSVSSVDKNLNDFGFIRHTDRRRKRDRDDEYTVFSHPKFQRNNQDDAAAMTRGTQKKAKKDKKAGGSLRIKPLPAADNVW
ncbi:hypothetical protein GGI12_003316, partial [Dipsacomyces acuminosporus]